MDEKAVIKFKKLREDAIIPQVKTAGSACFDIYIPKNANIQIGADAVSDIELGFATEIPEGYHVEIFVRSSMVQYEVILLNSVGIIDSDYRGEWKAWLKNISRSSVSFKGGDRILQARLVANIPTELVEVGELSKTERGTGGFGSTGK